MELFLVGEFREGFDFLDFCMLGIVCKVECMLYINLLVLSF